VPLENIEGLLIMGKGIQEHDPVLISFSICSNISTKVLMKRIGLYAQHRGTLESSLDRSESLWTKSRTMSEDNTFLALKPLPALPLFISQKKILQSNVFLFIYLASNEVKWHARIGLSLMELF
jgi:hypothetical protein